MTDTIDQSDDALPLRIRKAVDEQYVIILALLVLLLVGGLWASYTAHISPGTETETEVDSRWSRTSTFSHGATVAGQNPVYETNQRLRNQRAYFPLISPRLTGEYQFQYTASGDGAVDVDITVLSIVQSRGDGTVFWQQTREIGSTTAADVEPGGSANTEFEFNLNQTRLQLERVEETLGETPGDPIVVVQAQTQMTGQVNGRTVNREFVDEIRFIPDGDSFVVNDPGEMTNTSRQVRSVTTTREYSPIRSIGGPAILVVSVGGLASLVLLRRRNQIALSPAERDRLTHVEYAEWISIGTLSEDPHDSELNVVEMSSLVDLVNVAADAGERVVYDPAQERYAVFDGDRMYFCTPPLQ